MLAADDARGILTHVQSKLKAASSRCADGTFDLHVLPNVGWERGRRRAPHRPACALADPGADEAAGPRHRAAARAPTAAVVPAIDQRLFCDPGGDDLAVLAEGIELAGAVAATDRCARCSSARRSPIRSRSGASRSTTRSHLPHRPARRARHGGRSGRPGARRGRPAGGRRVRVPDRPARQHAPVGARPGRGDGGAARRLTRCRRCGIPAPVTRFACPADGGGVSPGATIVRGRAHGSQLWHREWEGARVWCDPSGSPHGRPHRERRRELAL